jgi:hypothetical protein
MLSTGERSLFRKSVLGSLVQMVFLTGLCLRAPVDFSPSAWSILIQISSQILGSFYVCTGSQGCIFTNQQLKGEVIEKLGPKSSFQSQF